MGSSKHVVTRPQDVTIIDELPDEAPTHEYVPGEVTPNDPDTPVEQRFLLRILDHPDDHAMRMVYADWLEQRGQQAKAQFLQRTAADPPPVPGELRSFAAMLPAEWLSVVSRVPIEFCGARGQLARCPQRWEALASTDTTGVRHCQSCVRDVFFCASLDEVRTRGRQGACVAFSPALIPEQARDEYDGNDFLVGEISFEPDDR
jgi:uncharacterized protein (TIGR02996 family)